jgi:hypothetical protein
MYPRRAMTRLLTGTVGFLVVSFLTGRRYALALVEFIVAVFTASIDVMQEDVYRVFGGQRMPPM